MSKRLYPYSLSDLRKIALEFGIDGIEVKKIDHFYSLFLGITSRCNFDCPICYYHTSDEQHNEKIDFPIDVLKVIMDNCGCLNNVSLALEGEPFCYPYLFDALDIISKNSDSISISTNCSLLDKEKINRLKIYNFFMFSLSIDSGSNEHYKIVRKGGNLNYFMKNASDLADALEDSIYFNSVIYRENLNELINIPKIAYTVGVNKISFMLLREHEKTIMENIHKPSNNELKRFFELILENAEKYNVQIILDQYFGNKELRSWLRKIESPSLIIYDEDQNFCLFPFICTSLLSNLELFPCCGDFSPEKIDSYTFDSIFNHEYLKILRALLDKKIIIPVCKVCRNIIL